MLKKNIFSKVRGSCATVETSAGKKACCLPLARPVAGAEMRWFQGNRERRVLVAGQSACLLRIFFLSSCARVWRLTRGDGQDKTFRPKKGHSEGTKRYDLHKHAKATLGSGNLQAAVKLPDSEEKDEWLAVHTVDFYNQINLLYGSITDWCTKQTCPIMSAGSKFEYHWADGVKVKTPIALR
jgi:hypothetical protein